MAPVSPKTDVGSHIDKIIANNAVVIFSKTTCPHCEKAKNLLKSLKIDFFDVEVNLIENGAEYVSILTSMTGQKTVPNIFVHGRHIGGNSDLQAANESGVLKEMLAAKKHKYEYDLIVIGGGSGGLVAAKDATKLGKKVACCDFVSPSPQGSTWGLGGTCVNVGCIPKKFMHHAAILGHSIKDSEAFGWEVNDTVTHNWGKLKDAVQDYIGSLNWGYKVELRDIGTEYFNANAELIDVHTVQLTTKKGKVSKISGDKIILAMGTRPIYPDIPGMKEYAISSDDIFSLSYPPGKTLCIGASYVSLECAGFLRGLGFDVTVMVRSILLRGFDQQMAEKIGDYMASEGVEFLRPCVPTKIEKLKDGEPGLYKVTYKNSDGTEDSAEFNTILVATGRSPNTFGIGLENVGVKTTKQGYVPVNDKEQTSVDNIYCIGDILENRLELTPLAIQTARLLVQRLFAGSSELCDYINVPTTVFTPLEYGCIGYTEDAANDKFGEENIEVYHNNFRPYEWVIPGHDPNICYAKLICLKTEKERVIGFHVVGPFAGEITQGYAIAMKAGATKAHFNSTIGIHPTSTEVFTTLNINKRSGTAIEAAGCGG